MKISIYSVYVGFTAICLTASATGADWPGWRGINRDAKSAETGLQKIWTNAGPSLIWKTSDLGRGFSSIAVVKDMVYVTGDVGDELTVFAFDSKGQQKWKVPQGPAFKANFPGSRATPVVDGDKLYVIGGSGVVSCHNLADGRELWKRDMKEFGGSVPTWGFSESPLILDNMAIVTPGGKNAMVALDKATGKNIWTSDFPGTVHYCSAIAIKEKGSTIIVQGTGDGLVAVNPKTGKKIWSNPFSAKNTANCPTPAYDNGYLFWANGYGKGGICIKVELQGDKWNFSEAWTTKDMVSHHGGYIIEKGFIYGNHNDGWSCLDIKTGSAKWKGQKGVGKGSICYADGMLYLFGESGGTVGLAEASPDAFKMSGSFKVAGSAQSWAHPAISDGRLYIRYDTNLYCYDIKGK